MLKDLSEDHSCYMTSPNSKKYEEQESNGTQSFMNGKYDIHV